MLRMGDKVRHRPSGEEWLIAYETADGDVAWLGWPDGRARASDCELLQAATDTEHWALVEQVAFGTSADSRVRHAQQLVRAALVSAQEQRDYYQGVLKLQQDSNAARAAHDKEWTARITALLAQQEVLAIQMGENAYAARLDLQMAAYDRTAASAAAQRATAPLDEATKRRLAETLGRVSASVKHLIASLEGLRGHLRGGENGATDDDAR